MGMKIGMCRVGRFASRFVALFQAHPLVDEVVLADLIPERAQNEARAFGIKRVLGSLDELCESVKEQMGEEFFTGVTSVHPVERLPDTFRGLPNGHNGSHQFLVDDFCRAWATHTLPPCHVWNAARWNVPGLIAHESAKQDGKMLEIPDFGKPKECT